jgi:hypothetical protein
MFRLTTTSRTYGIDRDTHLQIQSSNDDLTLRQIGAERK